MNRSHKVWHRELKSTSVLNKGINHCNVPITMHAHIAQITPDSGIKCEWPGNEAPATTFIQQLTSFYSKTPPVFDEWREWLCKQSTAGGWRYTSGRNSLATRLGSCIWSLNGAIHTLNIFICTYPVLKHTYKYLH